MRHVDGRYKCVFCGAVLDIPSTTPPKVTVRGSSGSPTTRSVALDGKEIHRCEIGVTKESGRSQARG